VRWILPAALLGALALAGSAAAAPPLPPPYVIHTVIGGHAPIRVLTSVTPPVTSFGDAVTATVVVVADRKWVDPSRVRPRVQFSPYEQVAPPTSHESENGRLVEIRWAWKLRCLTAKCVPIVPPSDLRHVFHFAAARIQYLGPDGKVAWTTKTRFPAVEVLSSISPGIVTYLNVNKAVKWQYQLTPAAVSYRVSPSLLFLVAVLLSGICVAAAFVIATRWVVRLRSPVAVTGPDMSLPPLERALALFFWAGRRGDETLQRKALERVAAELPTDVSDLSNVTRELAWSPELPEEDEVEAISEQAGVPAHHEGGADE
jgi:hypothetical protein